MGRKKPGRKAEPASKHRIAWPRWTGFRGKTIWDWLQLLIVPLALAVIGFWFTVQQDQRQQAVENQRAQDTALQAYLDQMSQLILQRDLLESEPGDPAYTLAQARTSTIILRLDAEHNESVIRFLSDSGLAGSGVVSISLLTGIALSGAELSGADLSGANMFNAHLSEADLNETNLFGAHLNEADLTEANLSEAYLFGADLYGADLVRADLSGANLTGADLRVANLIGADLGLADLGLADLNEADLTDANLTEADLSQANLSGVKGIASEELERQADTLEGATMPDGQKYEE